jgi:CubicO group peptidase (beta-lactamase class C family)
LLRIIRKFKKGYGYSDLENNIKVDPDKTKFPAASVDKNNS